MRLALRLTAYIARSLSWVLLSPCRLAVVIMFGMMNPKSNPTSADSANIVTPSAVLRRKSDITSRTFDAMNIFLLILLSNLGLRYEFAKSVAVYDTAVTNPTSRLPKPRIFCEYRGIVVRTMLFVDLLAIVISVKISTVYKMPLLLFISLEPR